MEEKIVENKAIYLSQEEVEYLNNIVSCGSHTSQMIRRAHVLLLLNRSGKKDHTRYKRIAEYSHCSVQAVYNMRDDYLECRDIDEYLSRKKRETPPVPAKIDGEIEARVIAIACSEPPEGERRWTLRSISDRCVELDIIDSISHTTVKKILEKRGLKLI